MILYEYEGKKLLKEAGIEVPDSQLVDSITPLERGSRMTGWVVLKAQVLSGKRAESGGIVSIKGQVLSIKGELEKLFGKTINNEKVEKVLVEELVDYEDSEYYISISYDTETRGPILTISESGGTGVEERRVYVFPVDPITQTVILRTQSEESPTNVGAETSSEILRFVQNDITNKLIKLFFEQDCLLLEINPLVKTKDGKWVALDAKVKLDDSAASRHEDWQFPPRSTPGHTPTKNEIEAKKIDEGDYRGVAGSTYFDLPGDIAILSSGGGVSLTSMDALIKEGGKPANFTEYSGNPPKEKVVKLTKVVLNKPNIHGLWVIGTVVANFTDIYETLSGLIDGLRELKSQGIKLDFPIVIRRGGPRDKEAFEMLEKVKDFNLTLQGVETSIAQSAKIMADLAKKYAFTS